MITRREILERSRRQNYDENVWSHPFSGRVSSWCTWVFVNLGLSANQVTMLVALCGISAALVLLFDSFWAAAASWVLFRLHVLFDVVDGEVARYRNQISRFAVYWDQLIHITVLPLIAGCLMLGRLFDGADLIVAVLGVIGMVGKSLDLGANVSLYKVIVRSGPAPQKVVTRETATPRARGARKIVGYALHLVSPDGLLFFYAIGYLIDRAWLELLARDWVFGAYSLAFLLVAVTRSILTARLERRPLKRDFR